MNIIFKILLKYSRFYVIDDQNRTQKVWKKKYLGAKIQISSIFSRQKLSVLIQKSKLTISKVFPSNWIFGQKMDFWHTVAYSRSYNLLRNYDKFGVCINAKYFNSFKLHFTSLSWVLLHLRHICMVYVLFLFYYYQVSALCILREKTLCFIMNLGLGPFWNSARDVAFVPGNTIVRGSKTVKLK